MEGQEHFSWQDIIRNCIYVIIERYTQYLVFFVLVCELLLCTKFADTQEMFQNTI